MSQKFWVCAVMILSVVLVGCGKDEEDTGTGSTWVGEVYADAGSGPATVTGEFGSYDECVEMTQKEAGSGVFNCGVKQP